MEISYQSEGDVKMVVSEQPNDRKTIAINGFLT